MKAKSLFVCRECGYQTPRWLGCCPECEAWDTLEQRSAEEPSNEKHSHRTFRLPGTRDVKGALPINEIGVEDSPRLETEIGEFDRVTGGGLVPGSLLLLGGDPGIGKSTLVLQVLNMIAAKIPDSEHLLYVSGEESAHQVALRAQRLGAVNSKIHVFPETSVEKIEAQVANNPPSLMVVDSIQTVYRSQLDQSPGTVTQIRESAAALLYLGKSKNITIILIGHVTKQGNIAGPRVLEHIVDTVLYLEGSNYLSYRILRAVKNRFGPAGEIGVFSMDEDGLQEVSNPSELFLVGRDKSAPGSSVAAIIEGSRSLLVEIQALVTPSAYGTPQRVSYGIDSKRLAVILAVMEKRLGLKLFDKDVFVNVPGGLNIKEPAVDLAIGEAVISALSGKPVPLGTVFVGEIGLTGELRSVVHLEQRVREASRLGFKKVVLPAVSKLKNTYDIELIHRDRL